MAAATKRVEFRIQAPGPWAQRRIAFQSTSTYSSTPSMLPLNGSLVRGPGGDGGGNGGAGGARQQQEQQQRAGSELGKSEPYNLPSCMPLQWTAPQKIGAGLTNLGNTCFLNSVLQCLTYTPPLAGYLQSGQHKVSCSIAGFCAFCALQEHVQQTLASSGKVVSPQKLAKNLRSISRSFRMGRQEDSHEYMRYLLEALHKCCLPPDLAKNSNSKSSQEKSLVYKIFGGQLRSQVKCTVCSHCSNTYDPFLDLSLEIVRADSLPKALARFTAVDVLDGDNKYRCLRCKKKVRALKHFTIDTVPNILTIQFKRFSSSGANGGKIDKKVDFGTTLDLKPFISSGQESVPKYKLFGVLVHSGWSTHSGHYYCFLRGSSDIWHVFDDSRVRQVSERTVLEQKAYMLFYVREGKRASGSQSEVTTKRVPSHPDLVVSKEIVSNPHSEGTPRQSTALPHPVSVLSKEKESNADSGLTSGSKGCSEPVIDIFEDREKDSQPEVLAMPIISQPVGVIPKDNGSHDVQTNVSNGISCTINASPAVAVPEHQVAPAAAAVVSSNVLVEVEAAGLSTPFVESCAPAKENDVKDMEIDNCCTTSGTSGTEDDWDEFYKKGWNAPGSTPQNFMKMLRVIPHTRRYYQARAVLVRKGSRGSDIANGELENGHPDPSEALSSNFKKEVKRRCPAGEEVSGSKRQQMESGEICTSDGLMLPDQSTTNIDRMEVIANNGDSPVVKESSLRITAGGFCEGNGSVSEPGPGNKADDAVVSPKILVEPIANGQVGDKFSVAASRDASGFECGQELQDSGVDLRVDQTVEVDCQAMERIARVVEQTHVSGSSPQKCTAVASGTGHVKTSNLYGSAVPRWNEVDGDEHLVKEIDRLLEPERVSDLKQDTWDLEYDRGRSKKVRNKSSQEIVDGERSSNGIGSGISRPCNPFQAFGIAHQSGNAARASSDTGIKSGNGYSAKAGKSANLPTGRRFD